MNKKPPIIICLLGIQFQMLAQTAREYFDSFRQQVHQEYNDFRQQANVAYIEFMRQAWVEYQKMPAIPVPEVEPTLPPIVIDDKELNKPIEYEQITIEEVVAPIIGHEIQSRPIAPIRDVPHPTEDTFEFVFMGTEETVRIGNEHRIKLSSSEENAVADAWTIMCHERYNNVIRDCLMIRLEQNLCDWAYYVMLRCFGEAFYGEGTNESVLLAAFIYCQSGYSMRLANTNGQLDILFSSKHNIFTLPYYVIDGERFYTTDLSEEQTRLMPFSFESEQPMSLIIRSEQKLRYVQSPQRTLKSDRYPAIQVTVSANKNLVDFYSTYPPSDLGSYFMTRWVMYANTPLAEKTMDLLYSGLSPHIKGLNNLEAANRLLNWVQTGFVYEYDDKVWGGDRAFFAEETLYYPYCDCEDRSILFSRLVRDLLGLDVVLVYYPGHLATAVAFEEDVKGDYLMLNGRKFVVADPTYIGAPVGRTMPQMDNQSAKVILLQ